MHGERKPYKPVFIEQQEDMMWKTSRLLLCVVLACLASSRVTFSGEETTTGKDVLVLSCKSNRYMIMSWVKGGGYYAQEATGIKMFQRRQENLRELDA